MQSDRPEWRSKTSLVQGQPQTVAAVCTDWGEPIQLSLLQGATTKLLTHGKRSSEMASAGAGAELLQITELCCFYSGALGKAPRALLSAVPAAVPARQQPARGASCCLQAQQPCSAQLSSAQPSSAPRTRPRG